MSKSNLFLCSRIPTPKKVNPEVFCFFLFCLKFFFENFTGLYIVIHLDGCYEFLFKNSNLSLSVTNNNPFN